MTVRAYGASLAAMVLVSTLSVGCGSNKAEQAANRAEDAAKRAESAASRVVGESGDWAVQCREATSLCH